MEEFLKWLQENLPKQLFRVGIGFVLLLLGGSRIAELLLQFKQLRPSPKDPRDVELQVLEREMKIAKLKDEFATKELPLPELSPSKIAVATPEATASKHAMSWVGQVVGSAEPAMRPINRLPRFLRIPIAIAIVAITGTGSLLMLATAFGAIWTVRDEGIGGAVMLALFSFSFAMVFSYLAFEAAVRIRGGK